MGHRPRPAVLSILWERRAQIGCCLLIQALLVGFGHGLERLLVPGGKAGDTVLARTRP